MKIAFVSDLHFGARNDSSLFHDYFEKFYKNTFLPYLKENDITVVFDLGDTFDKRKQINFISLDRSMEYFFNPLKDAGIDLYCMVGNHDAPFKDTIKVSSPKLLLSHYKNIHIIDSPAEFMFDGVEFLFIPWMCGDNQADAITAIKNTTAKVMLSHLELAGFEMHKGQLSDHGHLEMSVLKKFDNVYSGHYHHRSSQGNVTYIGNPYELTWNDYDDPRGFCVYDTATGLMEFIQNPYSMFKKIFYDDENKDPKWVSDFDYAQYTDTHVKIIVVKKTDFLAFDTFIHNLQAANPAEHKIIEDFSEFEDAAIEDDQIEAEDTLTLLNSYIDAVDTDINKDRLKQLMRELYVEANVND